MSLEDRYNKRNKIKVVRLIWVWEFYENSKSNIKIAAGKKLYIDTFSACERRTCLGWIYCVFLMTGQTKEVR